MPVFIMVTIGLAYLIFLPIKPLTFHNGALSDHEDNNSDLALSGTDCALNLSYKQNNVVGRIQEIRINTGGEILANRVQLSSSDTLQTTLKILGDVMHEGFPIPTRDRWVVPGEIPPPSIQRQPSKHIMEANNVSVSTKDMKLKADWIRINRGTLGFFRTSLFNELSAKGAHFEFSEFPIRWVAFEKGNINYPVGNAYLTDGTIYEAGSSPKAFHHMVISARSGVILKAAWSGEPENRPLRGKRFLGMRSALPEYR